MNIRLVLLVCALFTSISSLASIDSDDLIKALKGSYILQSNEVGDIHFIIRSSGKLLVTKSDWYSFNDSAVNYPAKISIEQGDNGLLRGLPVAHLIFSEGADEQAIDCHLILTAEQGWHSEEATLRLLSSFSLENDGPNGVASVLSTKLLLLKYNVDSKKFLPVK